MIVATLMADALPAVDPTADDITAVKTVCIDQSKVPKCHTCAIIICCPSDG